MSCGFMTSLARTGQEFNGRSMGCPLPQPQPQPLLLPLPNKFEAHFRALPARLMSTAPKTESSHSNSNQSEVLASNRA